MILVIWVVLTKADLLSLLGVEVGRIQSQTLAILLVSIYWLKVSWVAQRILLELLSMNALDNLRLLLAPTEYWRKLLTIIT